MKVDYTNLSPHKYSPRGHVIDTVTIHCFVGQWTIDKMCNEFASSDKKASCNYCVDKDGKIGLVVQESDASWCSSNESNDRRAITIEMACDTTEPYAVTPAAYAALIDLLVDICKRNPAIGHLRWKNDKGLIGQVNLQNMTAHRWFKNKACPGNWLYDRFGQIASEVNAKVDSRVTVTNIEINGKVTSIDRIIESNYNYVKLNEVVTMLGGTVTYDAKRKIPVIKI